MASEIASTLLRTSLQTLTNDRAQCSRCRRTPLTGELMHVLESGRHVCALCVGRLPERDGEPIRSERVHASDRPLAVVARAA